MFRRVFSVSQRCAIQSFKTVSRPYFKNNYHGGKISASLNCFSVSELKLGQIRRFSSQEEEDEQLSTEEVLNSALNGIPKEVLANRPVLITNPRSHAGQSGRG